MPEPNEVDFVINIEMHSRYGGGGFQLREQFPMREATLSELTEILARFDELFQAIKRQRELKKK